MVRRALAVSWLFASVLLCFASPAAAGDRFEPVREMARRAVEAGEVPSVAVAVVEGGEVVWEEAFGWADREDGVPASPHTLYSLASVSKPLTATGLMVLVARGLVDLDRPIEEYLGGTRLISAAGSPAEPTVRQVATHTAGLPFHHQFFPEDEGLPPPMEETLRRFGILVSPPGERFEYSNLGYGILGHLVGRIGARGLPRALEEDVFRPLGLAHTAVVIDPGEPGEAVQRARRYGRDGTPLPFYDSDHRGSSALWACIHDLARFAQLHLGTPAEDQRPILSRSAIEEMQRPHAPSDELGRSYGLGWVVTRRGQQRMVLHTGGMSGATAYLALIPSRGLALAAVANARSELPLEIGRELLDRLAPVLPESSRGVSGLSGGGAELAPERGSARAPRRWRGTWRGTVRLPDGSLQALTLEIGQKSIQASLDGRTLTVHGARYRGAGLRDLRALGRARLEDGEETLRLFVLSLTHRGDRLTGGLTALSQDRHGLPRALTHLVQAERARRASPESRPG